MKQSLSLVAFVAALPAFAEDTRHLDAHEHGVGELNIAIDGATVMMELHAPGADIVGFEYEAKNDADHAAIDSAVTTLGAPLDLFVLPEAAACMVTAAKAELESDDDHDEHDEHEEEHHDDDHGDDTDEEHADDDEHEEEHHDDDHGDETDEEHADEAGHTEFHAEYTLTCDNPDALTGITFAYFETFPNAKEVEVQIITSSGAQAFEVERDSPVLELGR